MSADKPKVLVMGATGQVGKAVLPLLRNQNVEVLAATRKPAKWNRPDFKAVHLDLDDEATLGPALEGVDRVFMVTGYTVEMLRQSKAFLDAAKKAGVKHIVHLGSCGDDDTTEAQYAWHQLVERYIEWCGFSFTHLRPEVFMQNLFGYGGDSYVKNGVIRHYVGNQKLSWVDIEDVAAVAAAALLDPEKHNGQTYRMGYEALTYNEVAAICENVFGQKFVYEPHPPEEFLKLVLAAGANPGYMQCVYNSYCKMNAGTLKGCDETFDNFKAIVGREPNTMTNFARTNFAKLRYIEVAPTATP